jgi:uncharacterized repeat protein (TIGR03847 family)
MEIELDPIDFLTVGTVGPKGRRVFHLQAAQNNQLFTLTLEKEQIQALGEALAELVDDLQERFPTGSNPNIRLSDFDMNMRDPIDPLFRVAQIGLGYDERRDRVVLVLQELVVAPSGEDAQGFRQEQVQPRVARFWGSRDQFRALSLQAKKIVKKGRVDPKTNGRLIYYWT